MEAITLKCPILTQIKRDRSQGWARDSQRVADDTKMKDMAIRHWRDWTRLAGFPNKFVSNGAGWWLSVVNP